MINLLIKFIFIAILIPSMASSKEATLDLNGWDESIIDFREVEWDYYWNEFLPR